MNEMKTLSSLDGSPVDLAHVVKPLMNLNSAGAPGVANHPPRILLLYGSVRARSYSRLVSEEAARLLQAMGAETRTFSPSGLPLPDDAPESHSKVQELTMHW